MQLIIYESSAFGGCYDYARHLAPAYAAHPAVRSVRLLLPAGAAYDGPEARRVLWPDWRHWPHPLLGKLYFLWRQVANPLTLFGYLLVRGPRWVLLNDFEQATACLWAPLYRWVLFWHRFAVFLHDPDRDAYPPSPSISAWQMRCMMRAMHLGFYHETLPAKPYYRNKATHYLALPHGLYPAALPDTALMQQLAPQLAAGRVFTLLGNIRPEKNLALILQALAQVPDAVLLVAGRPANSSVDVAQYQQQAQRLGVAARVVWLLRYLTQAEMSAVIELSHVVLLYYSATFASQSAVLNQVAPFGKALIVSRTASALAYTVQRFGNAYLVEPDQPDALAQAMRSIDPDPSQWQAAWQAYRHYASWQHHVQMAVAEFESL